jgi:hypothetical protein
MPETLAALSARVDQLERVLRKLVEAAKRYEVAAVAPLRTRQVEGVTGDEYDPTALIG